MMEMASELKSIWYLVIAIITLVVWLVRRKASGASFDKIDAINETIPVMQSKISVHSDLLKPDKLAEHYTKSADFQARTEERVQRLIEAARKSGAI
jgi:hypothetical protein